jgi:PBP1b-binding outer membrane lipoprotein LpoB
MKKLICILAGAALFGACEQKTTTVNPPAEKKTENNTTVVNPPGEKKTESNTTIVQPGDRKTESKTITTTNASPNP